MNRPNDLDQKEMIDYQELLQVYCGRPGQLVNSHLNHIINKKVRLLKTLKINDFKCYESDCTINSNISKRGATKGKLDQIFLPETFEP